MAASCDPPDLTDPRILNRLAGASLAFLRELGPRGWARDHVPFQRGASSHDLVFRRRKKAELVARNAGSIVLFQQQRYIVPDPRWLAEYERSSKLWAEHHPEIPTGRRLSDVEALALELGEWRPIRRSRGQRRQLDALGIREIYRERLERARKVRRRWLDNGEFPPAYWLPVLREPNGELLTIEGSTWPTRATWMYLSYAFGESRRTLQTLIKPSRSK